MTDTGRLDVAVIGGGPAGIAAAIAADSQRKLVTLINDQAVAGGQIWRRDVLGARPARAAEWLRRLDQTSVCPMNDTTVIDARSSADGHVLTVERNGQADEIVVGRVILATGARELFLPFPGWTLPGVFGVGALQAMVKGGLDVIGKRVVIAGSGPLLVAVAASLARRGAKVLMIAEQASLRRMLAFSIRLFTAPRIARDAIGYTSAMAPRVFRFGTWVASATGENRVREVRVTDGNREWAIECDLLCVGYGLVPNTELGRLFGCEATDRGIQVDGDQQTTVRGVYAAGECAGIAGVDAALSEGMIAGYAAAGAPDKAVPHRRARAIARAWGRRLESTFVLRPELVALAKPETIVCRCEDVRLGDLDREWTARQAKLYARVGMGPCQGRVCGPALRRMFGWSPDRVRAPIYPSLLSTLATGDAAPSSRRPAAESTS